MSIFVGLKEWTDLIPVSRSQPLHTATLICHLEIYFSKGLPFKAFHFVGQQGVREVDHFSFTRDQAMSWLMV